jgi:hypothetical protein
MAELPVVVLVAGMGRSGSTLLEAVLSEQLCSVAVGELRYLWARGLTRAELCSCGVPLPSCPFWNAALTGAFGDVASIPVDDWAALERRMDRTRHLPALFARALRSGGVRDGVQQLSALLAPLYRSIAEIAGCDIVIDSSKHPAYALMLLEVPGIRVAVVHLVRDSRAVVHSWQRNVRRPEVHWREEYMDRPPPIQTALAWDAQNLALELLGRRHPWYVRLRYEDFVEDPKAGVDAVVATCRAAAGREPAPAVGRSLVHSVAGNPLRFDEAPLTITPDVRWRQDMPRRQRLAVTALSVPVLKRYGYSISSAV